METRTDLDNLREGQEVLLFCAVGGDQTACLARKAWVEESCRAGQRVLRWQSTWDGAAIPTEWTPYAYAIVKAPDPALLENDYG